MGRIRTFELARWSEPDENHQVHIVGMADAQETFNKLEAHLRERDLLPDDYFNLDRDMRGELPEFEEFLCNPSFGASEGIYLDIILKYRDEQDYPQFKQFATGKTLGETADDFMRMYRIAAECSLMLNGQGMEYERNKVSLTVTDAELQEIGNVLELELVGDVEPEREAVLDSALDKVNRLLYSQVFSPQFNKDNILEAFPHLVRCAENAEPEEKAAAAEALIEAIGQRADQSIRLAELQAAMAYADARHSQSLRRGPDISAGTAGVRGG